MSSFTIFERTVLANQLRILDALSGQKDHEEEIDALDRGYELDIEEFFLDENDGLPSEDCKFVRDIFWIYFLMKRAKNPKFTAPDGRKGLSDLEPKFPGFDGNAGDGRYGYAEYLTKQRGQFPEHNHYMNSHGSQPNYESMIALWKSWKEPSELTNEQVDEILEAGKFD